MHIMAIKCKSLNLFVIFLIFKMSDSEYCFEEPQILNLALRQNLFKITTTL